MEQESWIYRTEVQERDLGWRYQLGFISIHIQETEQDHQSVNKTNIWAQGHSNVKRLKRIWWRLRRSEKWYRRKQRMRYTESQWREVIKDPLTNFQPHQLLLSTIPNYCLITVYDRSRNMISWFWTCWVWCVIEMSENVLLQEWLVGFTLFPASRLSEVKNEDSKQTAYVPSNRGE